jgi:hypothetical protein
MKAIGPMTSEELLSQREVGWTHEQRKEGTNAQTYAILIEKNQPISRALIL